VPPLAIVEALNVFEDLTASLNATDFGNHFEFEGGEKTLCHRERKPIQKALAQCPGRVWSASGAAAKPGIPRQTLESKILRLGINQHQFKN
jgi:hypothetical protein